MQKQRALQYMKSVRRPPSGDGFQEDVQRALLDPQNSWQAAVRDFYSPRSYNGTEPSGPFGGVLGRGSSDYGMPRPGSHASRGGGDGADKGRWGALLSAWNPWGDAVAGWHLLTGSFVNLLLPCCLLGMAAKLLGWGATPIFVLNLLGIIPLALLLGEVTEDLSIRLGPVVGGLINATFGNVVELILGVAALSKGLMVVVYMSLVGSILSNLLLVLGCSFLAGGLTHKQQTFNMTINKANNALLFLACVALVIPTAAHLNREVEKQSELLLMSRLLAIVLLFIYMCYLTFNLYTHRDMVRGVPVTENIEGGRQDSRDQEEEQEEPTLSLVGGFLYLGLITVVVAIASEFLTGAIEEVSKTSNLSQAFLGLVVLPVAGNASEHITAVMVAMHNKMDLSVSVAVGSSIQIALLVIPLITILGWILHQPFSLDMDPFATVVVTMAVLHANFVTDEAATNWLMGTLLIATYLLIAIVYAFKKD